MKYQYEITKLEPKHEYIQVKYTSEGNDDFYCGSALTVFTEESVLKFIKDGGIKAVDFWSRVNKNPESIIVPMTGEGESEGFIPYTIAEIPEHNTFTHYASQKPEPDENNVYHWEIKERSQVEKEDGIRSHRDALLKETDWKLFSDSPEPSQEWLDYRQALRDVTLQEGFPDNVIWPVKPTV